MKGGLRKKQKFSNAQKALIDAIWKAKGGPAAIAHLLNTSLQNPINWRNRGGVPLIYCMTLASVLKVSPWGLNYNKLTKFNMAKVPPWEVVVRSYNLKKSEVESILSLGAP